MKAQRVGVVLTLVNLGIMIFLLFHRSGPVEASSPAAVPSSPDPRRTPG